MAAWRDGSGVEAVLAALAANAGIDALRSGRRGSKVAFVDGRSGSRGWRSTSTWLRVVSLTLIEEPAPLVAGT